MKFLFAALLSITFLYCAHKKVTAINSTAMFDKQGHRGCRGLMPENTIPAMIKAVDLGVTTLELDVVLTKDREVILSHEPFFNHEITTKPDGTPVTAAEEKKLNIYGMTYEEVKRFDVGLKPHPRFPQQEKTAAYKPKLAAVIDSVEHHLSQTGKPAVYYNIETKCNPLTDGIYHPAPKDFVDALIQVIFEKKIQDRVIIQSFDERTLQYLHTKHPAIQTALLIEDYDKRGLAVHLESLGFTPTIYSPAYSLVNEELVKACHDKKIKIIPWTVNNLDQIRLLKKMGVDGVITDYPNLFSNL